MVPDKMMLYPWKYSLWPAWISSQHGNLQEFYLSNCHVNWVGYSIVSYHKKASTLNLRILCSSLPSEVTRKLQTLSNILKVIYCAETMNQPVVSVLYPLTCESWPSYQAILWHQDRIKWEMFRNLNLCVCGWMHLRFKIWARLHSWTILLDPRWTSTAKFLWAAQTKKGTAYKLMKLHTSSWNCMQAHWTSCKLELHESSGDCMQAQGTVCKLL